MTRRYRRQRAFQSTPPRGRRLHALQKSYQFFQFQSTPPRGRRRTWSARRLPIWQFQSTPPRGRRQPDMDYYMHPTQISIHASAREATKKIVNATDIVLFQSTPPRGRRRIAPPIAWIAPETFQSTPPRGRRRVCHYFLSPSCDFNPRLREGGDGSLLRSPGSRQKHFNPRLREGGDVFAIISYLLPAISIHASAREAT